MRPKWISRIELGEVGRVSHSSRQSRHMSSFKVYTLILYGSMASTVTLRFLRYFSSILYGCRAPVVSSSIITSVGPFVLSGSNAGVSVDGPMASVSARVSSVGGAGFAAVGEVDEVGEAGNAASEGCISTMCGFAAATWVVMGVSEVCAVLFAGGGVTAAEDWRVRISTGLDDMASELLGGRAAAVMGCGVLWGAVKGWSVEEAMRLAGRD